MAKKRKAKSTPKKSAVTDEGKPKKDTLDESKRKKICFDFSQLTTDELDPIIENLREVSSTFKQNVDIQTEILDQIALEGLTGITFGRLSMILDAVVPNLNSSTSESAQNYIWTTVVGKFMKQTPGSSVQAYYLDHQTSNKQSNSKLSVNQRDEERIKSSSSSQEHDQNKNLVIDKEIQLPSHTLKRIAKSDWMLHPVQDGQIMGSCAFYLSRVNITKEVVELADSLGFSECLLHINKKYDLKKVYLVADQNLRHNILLPSNYDPNIDLKLREYACLELIGRTRCLGIVFPNDKTLGRYRILLSAKGLITQFQQTSSSFIVHHIRRFSSYNLESSLKSYKNECIPSGHELVDIKSEQKKGCSNYDDDDDDDFDNNAANAYNSHLSLRSMCCNPGRLKCDRDMLKMVYDVIALSKGRTMLDIRRKLKIPKNHVRNHLKNLTNIKLIGSHTRIIGEKKSRVFRARHKSQRRKLLRKKALKGVMAKWDRVDLQARELLGHRRSHFSAAEDSLLMLCRITCLLLEPQLKKLSFCVPKQVIRDVLHDELHEAHDKTSDALLRRAKFLRHLPQNLMMVNEITAELREDPDILRLVQCRKDSSTSDEKYQKLFKSMLRIIRAKLPHLLGLKSTNLMAAANSNAALVAETERKINIKSADELRQKFILYDCRQNSTSSPLEYNHPATAFKPAAVRSTNLAVSSLIQLAQPLGPKVELDVSECTSMQTILLLTSFCTHTWFNLNLHLRVPVRVVGLDQEGEHFKEIVERAKECKETRRIIAELTSPNPTVDSRRALFVLRCGKLADALVVQPCDIKFTTNISSSSSSLLTQQQHASDDMQQQQQQEECVRQDELDKLKATCASVSMKGSGGVLKMIESIFSMISLQPGIEWDSLRARTKQLVSSDKLLCDTLKMMENVKLISSETHKLDSSMIGCEFREPRLFGYKSSSGGKAHNMMTTYELQANAYTRYCQLLAIERRDNSTT